MINYLLASHGEVSKGLYNTVKMLVGEDAVSNLDTYSLNPGEDARDYVKSFENQISESDYYVIFTDIYGGSVFNAFTELLKYDNVYLLTGMNVGIVLEILLSPGNEINTICQNGLEKAREGIGLYHGKIISAEDDEEF